MCRWRGRSCPMSASADCLWGAQACQHAVSSPRLAFCIVPLLKASKAPLAQKQQIRTIQIYSVVFMPSNNFAVRTCKVNREILLPLHLTWHTWKKSSGFTALYKLLSWVQFSKCHTLEMKKGGERMLMRRWRLGWPKQAGDDALRWHCACQESWHPAESSCLHRAVSPTEILLLGKNLSIKGPSAYP